MGRERNNIINIIRIIAMAGVLLDHLLANCGNEVLVNCGIQIGGSCVEIFFAISCFLYGQTWTKGVFKKFDTITFLKKRLLHIHIPLGLTIFLLIPVEYLIKGRFEIVTIVANLVGLGWAKPFGVAGHLWFITMLMIMYISIIILSHLRLDRVMDLFWVISFVLLLFLCWLLKDHMTTYSKIGPPWFILFGAFVFAKGGVIIKWCESNREIVGLLAFCSVLSSLIAFIYGLYDTCKIVAYPSFIIAGFLSFLFFMTFIRVNNENKTTRWLSEISYEVYLVHVPVIEVVFAAVENLLVATVISLVVTLLVAEGVYYISRRLMSIMYHAQ